MNEKNSFILYRDLYSQMTRLSPEDRGELFLAILEYENFGKVVTPLSPLADLAFSFIQTTLDRDRAAYEDRCQKNRENGKKGGRPRKNASPQKTDGLFSKPEKPYSENDSDSDSDSGIGIGIEIDLDRDSGGGPGGTEKDCGAVPKECAAKPPRSVASASLVTPKAPPVWEGEGSLWEAPPFTDQAPSVWEEGISIPQAPPVWEAPPQVPDAPHPRPLSEQEKEELQKKGVPLDYVTLRLDRARAYAKRRGISVVVVLWEWWQRDRLRRPWQTTASRWDPPSADKSYDVDDFFQAALERSYALLEQEVG